MGTIHPEEMQFDNASYIDPAGRVFYQNNTIYRGFYPEFSGFYRDFLMAGPVNRLMANGDLVPIASVYRHEPQTIRIRLEHPLAGKAQIRYLYGAMPDAKNPVMDNSPLSLPLEEFQSDIN